MQWQTFSNVVCISVIVVSTFRSEKCFAFQAASSHSSRRFTCNFLFADDYALISHTFEGIQETNSKFASRAFELTIGIKNTEVLFQPKPLEEHTNDTDDR